jgi:hypothetical protein
VAVSMTEELILLALLMLIGTHGLLVRGCMKLHQIIPNHGAEVASEASQIREILEELADLIHSGLDAIPIPSNTSQGQSLPEILLTGLMGNFGVGKEHGNTLSQEWQVQENDSPPTLETENELD